jgi:hypothetical protein
MTFGHGGNIYEVARRYNCRPSDIIDMSSNNDNDAPITSEAGRIVC